MVSPDRALLDEALSAVQDGRATAQDWARVEAAWSRDPALRERWLLWQMAGDGLRSPDLLTSAPGDLLEALHAGMPQPEASAPRRREWLAPFAVAAGFVAVALGVTALQPAEPPRADLALAAPGSAPALQGLAGASFAQTAAGRTLPAAVAPRDAAWPLDAPVEWPEWGASSPEVGASAARP